MIKCSNNHDIKRSISAYCPFCALPIVPDGGKFSMDFQIPDLKNSAILKNHRLNVVSSEIEIEPEHVLVNANYIILCTPNNIHIGDIEDAANNNQFRILHRIETDYLAVATQYNFLYVVKTNCIEIIHIETLEKMTVIDNNCQAGAIVFPYSRMIDNKLLYYLIVVSYDKMDIFELSSESGKSKKKSLILNLSQEKIQCSFKHPNQIVFWTKYEGVLINLNDILSADNSDLKYFKADDIAGNGAHILSMYFVETDIFYNISLPNGNKAIYSHSENNEYTSINVCISDPVMIQINEYFIMKTSSQSGMEILDTRTSKLYETGIMEQIRENERTDAIIQMTHLLALKSSIFCLIKNQNYYNFEKIFLDSSKTTALIEASGPVSNLGDICTIPLYYSNNRFVAWDLNKLIIIRN